MKELIVTPLLCLLMGYAMHRGSTCLLGAVFELHQDRRATRLGNLALAVLWIAALTGLGGSADVVASWPRLPAFTWIAAAGGALLGLGAVVNRACVMGTVARIGSGDLSYLWTPVGFFAACFVAAECPQLPGLGSTAGEPATMHRIVSGLALAVVLASLAWQSRRDGIRGALSNLLQEWSPRTATIIVGALSSALLLSVGDWTYAGAVKAAAFGLDPRVFQSLFWAACVIVGSLLSGTTRRDFKLSFPGVRDQCSRFVGGSLLGAGSLLIPGGNDTLVLHGLPMLSAAAWGATAVMLITMSVAVRWHLRRAPAQNDHDGTPA